MRMIAGAILVLAATVAVGFCQGIPRDNQMGFIGFACLVVGVIYLVCGTIAEFRNHKRSAGAGDS